MVSGKGTVIRRETMMDFTSGGLYFLGEVGRRWIKRLEERSNG